MIPTLLDPGIQEDFWVEREIFIPVASEPLREEEWVKHVFVTGIASEKRVEFTS